MRLSHYLPLHPASQSEKSCETETCESLPDILAGTLSWENKANITLHPYFSTSEQLPHIKTHTSIYTFTDNSAQT